jgi:hypothetical protein
LVHGSRTGLNLEAGRVGERVRRIIERVKISHFSQCECILDFHRGDLRPTDPVYVIVTPDQQGIADVRIGKTGFGKMYSKYVLAQDLHQTLLARKCEDKTEVPVGYGQE